MNSIKNYMYLKNLNKDFHTSERFNITILFADSSEKISVYQINEAVKEHMHLYQTCLRTAFNRFVKQDLVFKKTRDMENYLHEKFPSLSQTYIKDAIFEAMSLVKSRIETVEYHIKSLERYKNDLKDIMQPLPEKSKAYKRYLPKWQKTLKKLKDYNKQKETGNYKVVFGGQELQEELRKNPDDKELRIEWDLQRNRGFLSRGSTGESRGGNRQIRIIQGHRIVKRIQIKHPEFEYSKDVYYVRVTLGAILETMNYQDIIPEYQYVYGLLYRSDLEKYQNSKDPKKENPIDWDKFLSKGKMYKARLLRKRDDDAEKFELHISYDVSKDPEYDLENGCIGIDVNLRFSNLAYVDSRGRLRKWKKLPHPLLEYAGAEKRTHEAHRVARLIIEKAYENKMGIIVEDLRFYLQEGSKKFKRMRHNFAHRKLVEAIQRHACEKGVPIYSVNPAYTSIIGRVKYARMYGFSVHHGAAYVIGRRGLGLKEKIPKFIHKGLKKYTELGGELYNPTGKYDSWALWSILGEIHREHPDLFIK